MSYLRLISTRRLLALVLGCLLAIGVGAAAIALAAGGPRTPPARPLADAIHQALGAHKPAGIRARIEFTNHLVDAASLQGADPLLTGASGRLWASGDRLRLELQASEPGGGAGDVQVLVDGRRLSVIDTGTNTVYRMTLPASSDRHAGRQAQAGVPSVARIQQALTSLARDATVSGARPGNVAGRPAYSVRVSPRHGGGLLGGAELAWDVQQGVLLRAAVFARGSGSPVLELQATDVSFGAVAAGDLTVPPPAGAKVVDLSSSATAGAAGRKDHNGRSEGRPVVGLRAVQARVAFKVVAPRSVAGLARHEIRLTGEGGSPGALVTYGQGLGGIAVLQTAAEPGREGVGGAPGGLSLPKVSIDGASGQELDTALGTVLRFQRGGVAYVVVGSVPRALALAAARAL